MRGWYPGIPSSTLHLRQMKQNSVCPVAVAGRGAMIPSRKHQFSASLRYCLAHSRVSFASNDVYATGQRMADAARGATTQCCSRTNPRIGRPCRHDDRCVGRGTAYLLKLVFYVTRSGCRQSMPCRRKDKVTLLSFHR
jgi:hypothetical protein